MHILIYVVSILLVLATITYARLQTYRSFASLEASFLHYMKYTEREEIDQLFFDQYTSLHVQSRQPPAQGDPKPIKAEGTSRLSLHLILDQTARNKQPEAYRQSRTLLKRLMTGLYGKQKFFQEMQEKYPQFLDEIIDNIQNAVDNAPEKVAMANVAGLSRIQLPSDLHYVLFLMLQGLKSSDKIDSSGGLVENVSEEVLDTDDEEEASMNAIPVHSAPGYESLLDFTTTSNQYKIRVFLAPPQLLMAIYDDMSTVNQIIEMRQELYKQLKADPSKKGQLSTTFEQTFSGVGSAVDYAAILNFAVTNTNPKKE